MGFFDRFWDKKEVSTIFTSEEIANSGVCPNCWGKQEYDGQYIDYVKDQTKSNISGDKLHQKAFIQQFVETYLTGIQLKNDGNHKVCTACQLKI